LVIRISKGVMNMSESDIATLRKRMADITVTVMDCADLLGINKPPIEECVAGDTIDQLIEGFDMLDGLGTVIRDQLGRL